MSWIFFKVILNLSYISHFEKKVRLLQISKTCDNFQFFFSKQFCYFEFDEICAKKKFHINFMRFAVLGGQSCEIWFFGISTRIGIISNVWDRASISKALKFFFILQIFVLCFSTNRHVSRIGRLSWKFQKFSNFANSNFSSFVHESADSLIFGAILRRSEICTFVKGGFFSYSSESLCFWRISKTCKFGKLEFFLYFSTNWYI